MTKLYSSRRRFPAKGSLAEVRHGVGVVLLAGLLSGCSVSSLWPFGSDGPQGRAPAPPANATAYQCDASRSFYLRRLEGGAVWVILPEREFRLDPVTGAAGRFGNGTAVLEMKGEMVTLTDGPGQVFNACRTAGAAPAKS